MSEPVFFIVWVFFFFIFALIALAGLKETLEEQSCCGNGASWEEEPEDLTPGQKSPGVNYSAQVLLLLPTSNGIQLSPHPPACFSPFSRLTYLSGFYW